MTFISYAQNFEDVMLWRALKHVERGFYIDVGAFSPDLDSVTRAFSERGWRGINIEPNPHYLAQLNARRPHDANLGIAVSDFDGEIELSVIEDTGLTTVDMSIAEGHANAGWGLSHITVPTQRLAQVWDGHVPEGQAVHFLKVDVEGHEAAVLRGADWSRHRPWIVVVEATLPTTQITSYLDWEEVLTQAGYAFVYWDGLNRYYLAKEHEDLADRFSAPPNVFDQFVSQGHALANERLAELDGTVSTLTTSLGQAVEERAALERNLGGLQGSLGDLQRSVDSLASLNTLLEREVKDSLHALSALSRDSDDQRRALGEAMDEVRSSHLKLDYMLSRSIWERLLFRRSGRPRKPFRVLLFHSSGKPRGIFRRWVLRRDGRVRKVFRMWMSSPGYQALPRAVRLPLPSAESASAPPVPADLSPRARHFLKRLEMPQTRGPED